MLQGTAITRTAMLGAAAGSRVIRTECRGVPSMARRSFLVTLGIAVALGAALVAIVANASAAAIGLADGKDRIAAESFDQPPADAGTLGLKSVGAETARPGLSGAGLRFAPGTSATVTLDGPLLTRAGTIALWVKPSTEARGSQTYLTASWSGAMHSYLALSAGWWEPLGADRLYFVLSNRQLVNCSAPYRPAPDKWSFITVTWSSGTHGYCRLFVNGERLGEFSGSFSGSEVAPGPLLLGSDAATSERRGRGFVGSMDELAVLGRAVSDAEVRAAYEDGRARAAAEDLVAGTWIDEALALPAASPVPGVAPAPQARIVFHENIDWAMSRQRRSGRRESQGGWVQHSHALRLVWPRRQVPHRSRAARSASRRPRIAESDPLAYLVDAAHKAGIQIHACLTVARRGSDLFPDFAPAGTPEQAYNMHDPAFRRFMVDLILEVAQRYPIDGVNLDYIRTMGICTTDLCGQEYENRFGRSLCRSCQEQGAGSARRDAGAMEL